MNNICLEQITTERLYIELMYISDKKKFAINVYPQTAQVAKIKELNRSYMFRHEVIAKLALRLLKVIGGKEVKYD